MIVVYCLVTNLANLSIVLGPLGSLFHKSFKKFEVFLLVDLVKLVNKNRLHNTVVEFLPEVLTSSFYFLPCAGIERTSSVHVGMEKRLVH